MNTNRCWLPVCFALTMFVTTTTTTPVVADDIVFRVEQAGNLDLDAQKLAAVLASDAVEVRVTVAPVIALPGWTGRIGLCGIRDARDVCIKKRWRSVFLRGSDVIRTGSSLRFHVPDWHWFGVMPYRPAGPVRVSLPAFWPGDLPLNIDTTLAELPGGAGARTLGDMHLSPPYVGLASWQRLTGLAQENAAPVWRMQACDPVMEVDTATMPGMRLHRRASAYAEWMRNLADNPWWAAQIEGVTQEQGIAPAGAQAWDWRRVTVVRGTETISFLRVNESRLLSSSCPGSTRHEFTWRNGALLGASTSEMQDVFASDAVCAAALADSRESLWWDGELLRHGRGGPVRQVVWERWRETGSGCHVAGAGDVGDVTALTEAAEHWRGVIDRSRAD